MRRGLFVGGVVVLLIGVLMVGLGYYVNANGTTTNVSAGQVLTLTPSTIGSASTSFKWSGAPSGATVYLITGTATCTSPSGVVASGSGSSGSFSASLSPGTTYSLYACTGGSGAAASFTYSVSGISYLMLIGIIVLIIGIILLALGMRAKKPAPVEAPPVPPT